MVVVVVVVVGQGLAAILARFDVTAVDKGLACVPCTSHKKERFGSHSNFNFHDILISIQGKL